MSDTGGSGTGKRIYFAPTLVVCAACGKIRGQHAGWDESCMLHAVEVDAETVVYDEHGRVTSAKATGRTLTLEEKT